jgi:hypothetical protein
MRGHPSFLIFGVLVCSHSELVSQSPEQSAPPGHLQAQLQMIELSSRLRLRTDSARQEGRLILRTDDSVGIRGAAGEVHLPLTAVDSVWVRRHYTGTGFLIGALLGAGAYVAFINSYEEGSDNDELDNIFGGLIWAGSVALGTIVGAITPHWKRVYP